MPLFKRKYRPRYSHVANRAVAARALFNEAPGAIPKVALTFDLVDGTTHTFELEVTEAAKLITTALSAYNAIMPPLNITRGSGW